MKKIGQLILIFLVVAGISLNTSFADGKEKKKTESVKVNGQVFDKNSGETLAGVQVKINELGYAVTTDLDGNFVIPELRPGEYTIELSYISYKTESVKINVSENKNNIYLNLKIETR